MRSSVLACTALATLLAACGSHPGADAGGSGDGATHGEAGAGGDATGTPDGGGSGTDGGTSPGADSGITGVGGPTRIGINFGYWGAQLPDEDLGLLASQSGAVTSRPKFPEYFLAQWGYDVRVSAMMTHATHGLTRHVAFLIGPTAAHSTAPAGGDLDQYIPQNLYEPITLEDGTVNPNNYWANYVYQTVNTYHPWVDTWEVWNEPDYVDDFSAVATWTTQAPTAAQLSRFHGDVFAYVRMLRVTQAAAHLADPSAHIAVGGLGYPEFLSAVLRYTDNPAGGAVSADYPATGARYFDTLSMHYYPLYAPGPSSDEGVDGFVLLHDRFAAVLGAAGVSSVRWVDTETGAPSRMFGTQPGGGEYARNYDMKVMTVAGTLGYDSVHWFILSNGGNAASTDPYDYMGWYTNLASVAVAGATRSDTGEANRTLQQVLGDGAYDAAATAALALPATARGGAFRRSDGGKVLVLWARTHGASETATASVTVPSTNGFDSYAWDAARSGMHASVAASGGHATLMLTDAPQLFVARP